MTPKIKKPLIIQRWLQCCDFDLAVQDWMSNGSEDNTDNIMKDSAAAAAAGTAVTVKCNKSALF